MVGGCDLRLNLPTVDRAGVESAEVKCSDEMQAIGFNSAGGLEGVCECVRGDTEVSTSVSLRAQSSVT